MKLLGQSGKRMLSALCFRNHVITDGRQRTNRLLHRPEIFPIDNQIGHLRAPI